MLIFPLGPLLLILLVGSAVVAADGWKTFVFVYGVAIVVIGLLVWNRRRKDERKRQRDRRLMANEIAAAMKRGDV